MGIKQPPSSIINNERLQQSFKYFPIEEALENPSLVTNLIIDLDEDDLGLVQQKMDTFQQLSSVRLRSQKSVIQELPVELLTKTSIRNISLSGEKLTAIPSSLFNLEQITSFSIVSKALTELPEAVWQLSQLQSLQFICPKLITLPNGIGQLKSLSYLRVYSDSLISLSDDLGDCPQLKILDINAKRLVALPDSCRRLPAIEWIRWAHCKRYPAVINNCQSLKEILLDKCQFEHIPSSISNLKKLEKLSLSTATFEQVPAPVSTIPHLKTLDLYDSTIRQLPSSLSKLKSLEKLNLSHCTHLKSSYEELPNLFNSLPALKEVILFEIGLEEQEKDDLIAKTAQRIKLHL